MSEIKIILVLRFEWNETAIGFDIRFNFSWFFTRNNFLSKMFK